VLTFLEIIIVTDEPVRTRIWHHTSPVILTTVQKVSIYAFLSAMLLLFIITSTLKN